MGTINLHEATVTFPLDFFVILASTESIWAPPTQSSYIAATNFQEHFARYRRRLGLPASTVAYGLVSDVDSDFKHSSVGTDDMYARNKALTTTEWNVLATLEPAFLSQQSTSWIGQKDDPLSVASYYTCLDPAAFAQMTSTNTPRWYSDGRVSLILRAMKDAKEYGKDGARDGGNDDGSASVSSAVRLRHAFDEAIQAGLAERETTLDLVTEGIMEIIAEMLFIDISNVNQNKSVAGHGVDSLIAAELRHWFHQALRTNLQMLDLLDAQTSIRGMAEKLVDKALNE
jgi:acyl carrier protein